MYIINNLHLNSDLMISQKKHQAQHSRESGVTILSTTGMPECTLTSSTTVAPRLCLIFHSKVSELQRI